MVLNWIDYAVIGGYLLAITAFVSYFSRFQRTTRDYFLTGRSVPWWAICFTIVATETSTLTFIGIPAQTYVGNMTFLQLAAGYIIGRIIVSLIFIPAYFRGELFTSYELLQRRFGTRVKTLSAVIFLVTPSVSMAAVSVMRLDEAGFVSQAAAFSTCIMAVVCVAALAMHGLLALLSSRRGR